MSKARKQDELNAMGTVAGVMLSLIESLKTMVREAGGTFADVYRLVTPEGADDLKAIVKLIVSAKKLVGLPVTYDQSIGIAELIKRALGPGNDRIFDTNITQERFPLKGTDVRTINVLRVEPFLSGETGEQAAKRLIAVGHVLANIGDLAGLLFDHPKEVEKWRWVVALSEDSRSTGPGGGSFDVPYAYVVGADRYFDLACFRFEFRSGYGVLVLCE